MKAAKKFKTTVKEVTNSFELRGKINREIYRLEREEKWTEAQELKSELANWQALYFDKLTTVFVSFSIGSRNYYRSVVKIGKAYFSNGDKMTKGRGYRFIEEIAEITPKMQNEMIEDAHYY